MRPYLKRQKYSKYTSCKSPEIKWIDVFIIQKGDIRNIFFETSLTGAQQHFSYILNPSNFLNS